MDSVGDLERLARSFERHLRAENKSRKTVTTYGASAIQLMQYLAGEGLRDPRDEAIIRLLADTGIRRGELLGMQGEDVDLDVGVVTVLGKGRRRRQVPVGLRRRGPWTGKTTTVPPEGRGAPESCWLTAGGSALQESGIATMPDRRGVRAGPGRVHARLL